MCSLSAGFRRAMYNRNHSTWLVIFSSNDSSKKDYVNKKERKRETFQVIQNMEIKEIRMLNKRYIYKYICIV